MEQLCRPADFLVDEIKEQQPQFSPQAWLVYDKCEEIRELVDKGLEAEEYLRAVIEKAEEAEVESEGEVEAE